MNNLNKNYTDKIKTIMKDINVKLIPSKTINITPDFYEGMEQIKWDFVRLYAQELTFSDFFPSSVYNKTQKNIIINYINFIHEKYDIDGYDIIELNDLLNTIAETVYMNFEECK